MSTDSSSEQQQADLSKTNPPQAEAQPQPLVPYCGELLTPAEAEAVVAHTAACERGDASEDCFPRVLHHGAAPRLPYRGKVYRLRAACHHGQSKLCVALLRFLSDHGHLAPTVVYAGAAPGTNIAFVARLFPDHTFHLYDPAPFRFPPGLLDLRGEPVAARLRATQDFFSKDTARDWRDRGEPVLFVSDIRSTAARDEDFEHEITQNMADQQGWYEILGDCVAAAQFKFRLPYAGGAVEYLAGALHLQAWAPLSSTETRLVVVGGGAPSATYDAQAYEAEMYYHNTVRREWGFYPVPEVEGGLLPVAGFDGCYDCRAAAEAYVDFAARHGAAAGLLRPGAAVDTAALYALAAALIAAQARLLAQPLADPPHGAHPGRPMRERRALLLCDHADASRRKHEKHARAHEDRRRGRGRGAARRGGAATT